MMLRIFDNSLDDWREPTQADIDLLEKAVQQLSWLRGAIHDDIQDGRAIGPATVEALKRFADARHKCGWAAGLCGKDLIALGLYNPWSAA